VLDVNLNFCGSKCFNFSLFILHTFQYLGSIWVSESTANNIFHYWLDIFTELLPASLLEQVKKKSGDFEWVLEILTQYSLTVDSTEQPIERPSDREEQEKFFSEKQKIIPEKINLLFYQKAKT